jgi:hypothetical protein
MTAWLGENPYYLLISTTLEDATTPLVIEIDLDRNGWIATLKDQLGEQLDRPGEWHLVRKDGRQVVFSVRVLEGDQPYYVARHVGQAGAGGQAEVVAYGIGKKTRRKRKGRWAVNEDNLWILPWGQICCGDVEHFAISGMRKGLR